MEGQETTDVHVDERGPLVARQLRSVGCRTEGSVCVRGGGGMS